jgi:hypothetical protein
MTHGPPSAHIGNALMREDPVLGMTIADGAWARRRPIR